MKNFLFLLMISVILLSCGKRQPKVVSVMPDYDVSNLIEWEIKLSSPVLSEKQQVQSTFLPTQVYEIFHREDLKQNSWFMGNALARKNSLPGNPNGEGMTGDFSYWRLKGDGSDWINNGQITDPKDFVYILNYKSNLIAMWFISETKIHLKKIQPVTKADRLTEVRIPLYDKNVEFKWHFEGIASGCEETLLKQVRGKITEYSLQNGYCFVTTMWKGGEKYKLPGVYTMISANGKILYAE